MSSGGGGISGGGGGGGRMVSAAPPSKCCCCKTRDGVVIIGISILIFSLITCVTLSHNLTLDEDEMLESFRLDTNDDEEIQSIIKYARCAIIISLLFALTTAFASVAMLWGMKKRRPEYLVPWICVSIPCIIFNLISSLLFITKVWKVTSKAACVIILVLVFGFYFLWAYCVLVVIRYRKRHRRKSSMTFNDHDFFQGTSSAPHQGNAGRDMYLQQQSHLVNSSSSTTNLPSNLSNQQPTIRVSTHYDSSATHPDHPFQPPLPPYEPASTPLPPPYSAEPSAPPLTYSAPPQTQPPPPSHRSPPQAPSAGHRGQHSANGASNRSHSGHYSRSNEVNGSCYHNQSRSSENNRGAHMNRNNSNGRLSEISAV
ncbi:uncharacterized protein LOC142353722 isoform X2 [Convolutriloba macropyga]